MIESNKGLAAEQVIQNYPEHIQIFYNEINSDYKDEILIPDNKEYQRLWSDIWIKGKEHS